MIEKSTRLNHLRKLFRKLSRIYGRKIGVRKG